MLSPERRRIFFRVVPFAVIWLVFSLVYSLLERGLLGKLEYYPATGNPYHFGITAVITAFTALVIGAGIGLAEVLYINQLFVRRSFIEKIIYKTMIYLAVIFVFLLINTVIYNAVELKSGIFSKAVWNNAGLFIFSYAFWSVEMYIAAIICFSLFYAEVSDNLGQVVLNNFISGKYHQPVVEERIFMFLDMRASTTIAEKLGHVRYFEMLKTYFADLTPPVIHYSGEIYQYVGDELVISWTLSKGLSNNNCIRCFFAMQEALQMKASRYIAKFGVLPGFKAGVHVGQITTGEIGIAKKDIIFTGDVLNTTARIQALCNSYKTDLLVSEQLLQRLDLNDGLQATALGESQLRGRDEKITLFTIRRV